MSDGLGNDPVFSAVRRLNDAVEAEIDIRPVVQAIIKGFSSDKTPDGLEGLGKEAVDLFKNVETDANKVRMMVEILRLVGNCSEATKDDLPDDPKLLLEIAKKALKDDE